MAVMDEFKEEREALKNGTPKQKLASSGIIINGT